MSAHCTILRLPAPERVVPARFGLSSILLVLAIVGAVLSLLGAIVEPHQFAYSWFFGFYFYFTICVGSLFWVLLHYVCNGSWDILIRRVWENLTMLFIPLLVVLAPLLLVPELRDTLWKWMAPAQASDHELAIRAGYLNQPFFYIRVLLYFAYFIGVAHFYRSGSVRQDEDGSPVWSFRRHFHSYLAMVVFALIETYAGFDWLMGLDWRWYSSLFGAYHFSVCAQAAMAACIVIVWWLRSHGLLARLNAEHFHLAGKLLFGFTILWAYFAFGQFLLIWYANIPEETIFYNDHNRHHWQYLTYFLIVGKFMFPAIYLLAQDTKRDLRLLGSIALWILFMHGVEMYWFVAPYAHERTLIPSWQDPVAFVTIGSILGFIFIRVMSSAALFPARDPRLAECLTVSN